VSISVVALVEMKRACRRLLVRYPDECQTGNQSEVFTADHDSLQIQVGSSSEILSAVVVQKGKGSVQYAQFSAMALT
jgi:hypothetical protein